MNKLKRIEKLENEVRELKNELYEILDNQKIKEMSKKYKVKIVLDDFELFDRNYILRLNNKTANTKFITNKHEYIQSSEFERDIKAFLYNRKKEDK